MKRIIKIRLYPNKSQKKEIFRQFNNHKDLYNFCLDERRTVYEKDKTSLSCYDQIKNNVKNFKHNCNHSSLQQTVRRLDKAFSSFFRRVKSGENPGYPRFKKRFNSIEFVQGDGCKIKGKRVYIQFIGDIKAVFHKEINNYSRIVLSYNNGDFYANFVTDAEIKTANKTNKSIGIDFGLKTFITTSDNQQIKNPRFHKKYEQKINKLKSRRDKLSKDDNTRKKFNKIISKTWKKIKNCRHNFNHKLVNDLINNYDNIFLEKISIKQLKTKVKNINKAYYDVCWNQFVDLLSYKAACAGKIVKLINPAYTSKKCSNCKKIHNLTLEKREINCECGIKIDRDLNASLNILTLGLQGLAQA